MAKRLSEFKRPAYYEHTIVEKQTGHVIGTFRIKPTGILWRGPNKKAFKSANLQEFITWIETNGLDQSR